MLYWQFTVCNREWMRRAATGQTDAAERDCVTAHRKGRPDWRGLGWAGSWNKGRTELLAGRGLLSTSPRFWMLDQPLQCDIWGRNYVCIISFDSLPNFSEVHICWFLWLCGAFKTMGCLTAIQKYKILHAKKILYNKADVTPCSFKIQIRTIIAGFVHVYSNFIKSDQQSIAWMTFFEGQPRSHHTGSLNRPLDYCIK